MKKLWLFIFCIFLFGVYNFAQTSIFAFKYKLDEDSLVFIKTGNRYVQFKDKISLEEKHHITDLFFNRGIHYEYVRDDIVKLETSGSPRGSIDDLSEILNADIVSYLSDELIYPIDSTIQWVGNDIFVRLKDGEEVEWLLNTLQISYTNYYNWNKYNNRDYIVSIVNHDTFDYASMLLNSGSVEYAIPSFYRKGILQNPYYNQQWNLKNTGQYCNTSGIDIKVEKAWEITTGIGIEVAVVDNGVQLNHPDLMENVVAGYDAVYNISNGGQSGADYHGTCCAGIIGAVNNNIGIKGIAYNSKIIPIRMNQGSSFTYDTICLNALIYAANSGAEIINCSWGGGSPSYPITTAINLMTTYGRNGKGCVMVFSSGNQKATNESHDVRYPAKLDCVIAVGAINPNGMRKSFSSCDGEQWASCYGNELDIVAPGVLVPTTDLVGNNGRNPCPHSGYSSMHAYNGGNLLANDCSNTDYTLTFNGTSSAAPHVSGVAALMLSANPNLTAEEVKEIIGETAKKLDGYTFGYDGIHENGSWNQYVGYGLIDAHKAVFEAFFRHHEICGPTSLEACDEYTYNFGNKSVPNWASLYWITSDNIEIVSGEHSPSVTVRPVGEGSGWIRAQFIHNGYYVIFDKQVNVISTLTNSICYRDYYADEAVTMPTDCIISDSFTIGNGGVVTISSTAYCSPNAKIIIQPGGKLVVDGGTLTNLCPDKMWDAIYVVGNYYQRQLAQYQGTIEVKNNSVIENSKWGIVTWNGSNYATSGGIVKCSSSTFRNNGKAIEFYPYTNHNSSGTETDNVNYAQKCTFVVDGNNLFASNNITFSEFVKISHVRGISFKGSSFRDGRATADSNTKGIYSDGAGFTASELCLYYNSNAPCDCVETATRTKFSRLGYGIYAVNDGTTYNFTADHAIFDTCYRAIQIDAVNNCKITRSDFDQSAQGTFTRSAATGVYLDNSTGYTVEANNFTTNYSTCPSGFQGRGVYVHNSSTDANTIYRNNMANLYHGVKSNGGNGGLQVLCNEFSNSFYADI